MLGTPNHGLSLSGLQKRISKVILTHPFRRVGLKRNRQPFVRLAISKINHTCDMNESKNNLAENREGVKRSHNFVDLTGEKYGRLKVLRLIGKSHVGHIIWECKCRCGRSLYVVGGSLKSGNTTSCGCFQKESASKRFKTHGYGRNTKEYRTWVGMKARCYNPNRESTDCNNKSLKRWLGYRKSHSHAV